MKNPRKISLIVLFSLFQILFSQNKITKEYLENPDKDDIFCIQGITNAKKDLKEFKGIYIRKICFGCPPKIYDNEIDIVAKKKNFKVFNNVKSCVELENENNCYETYVDLKMKDKYGVNYNEIINKSADSLFVSKLKTKNIILNYDDLRDNERPILKNWEENKYNVYVPVIKTKFNLKRDNINYCFLDLEFIIEKNGKIEKLKVINWVASYPENEKYKSELVKIAKETVKNDFNNWEPGNYEGNKVRVRKNFRISFQ